VIAMSCKKQYLGTKAVGIQKYSVGKRVRSAAVGLAVSLLAGVAQAATTVQDIEFSSRPGSKFEVRVEFNETPPDIKAYSIEKPARIALDFPDTTSSLERKRYSLPYGNATGAVVLESGDRTRLVVNLVKLVPYETRVEGNSLFLVVGEEGTDYIKQTTDPHSVATTVAKVSDVKSEINDLQFQRTGDGEGRLTLELTDPSVDVNVFSEAGDVKVEFLDTTVQERLMRRYDVTDFATPVNSVDVNTTERGATLTMKTTGEFD
jgi:type IV pilus assembly protein PilQ